MATDNKPFQSTPGEDLHIRVEHINDDPEEAQKAFDVLREAKLTRNTIYLSEFRTYEPIFRLTGRDEIGDERFNDLCIEWMNRVSNFDPVRIIDDDTNQVVMMIPPIFNRINPINVVKNGGDIATAFSNACQLPDEFNQKKNFWGAYYEKAIRIANPKQQLEASKQQVEKMTNRLKQQGVIRDPNDIRSGRDRRVISNTTQEDPSHKEQIHAKIEDADVEPL